MKRKLSYGQNVRAAIVFLNLFDLTIEERQNIFPGDTLKVMSSNAEEVGSVVFEEDKINIAAHTNLGLLSASYKTVTASGFRDVASHGDPGFARWDTDINYNIDKSDEEMFSGIFMIDCSVDEQFGTRCLCRTTLDYLVNGNKAMALKFKLEGETFGVQFFNNDIDETIKLAPFDDLNGFIIHDIKEGEYGDDGYPYRKYSCIVSAGDNSPHQFRALTTTHEHRIQHDFKNTLHQKNYKKIIEQMGTVMQELDPDMYKKITEVRKLLTAGETSLLDKLISVNLESFNDDEIQALFGLDRKPLEYGGKVKELKQIYFGGKRPLNITD